MSHIIIGAEAIEREKAGHQSLKGTQRDEGHKRVTRRVTRGSRHTF